MVASPAGFVMRDLRDWILAKKGDSENNISIFFSKKGDFLKKFREKRDFLKKNSNHHPSKFFWFPPSLTLTCTIVSKNYNIFVGLVEKGRGFNLYEGSRGIEKMWDSVHFSPLTYYSENAKNNHFIHTHETGNSDTISYNKI